MARLVLLESEGLLHVCCCSEAEGFGGVLLRHVAFILQDGFQDFIRVHFVFAIYLIIFYGFFTNVRFFYYI